MKHKLLQYGSIAAALVFVAVFFGLAIYNTPGSTAVKATDFQAGRIIDDEIFYNKDTMTVAEIQAFLDAKTPACDVWGQKPLGAARYHAWGTAPASMKRADYAKWRREVGGDSRYHDPPYVCVNLYYENPTTHETNFDTNFETKEGMLSAAEIIYQAAQKYNINPQVLLVMLKKESYAWGDDWPIKWGYNTIMGYGCPDTAPCDEKYYGFYNQMMMAAWQLNYYKDHIYSYGYFPYATNNIYYSPDYSCGSKSVYLENIATTSLYIYTPYTPNDAALRNYPGTATCGSYGNRNFFMYFNEWFGSTLLSNANRPYATDVLLDKEVRFVTADGKTIQLGKASKENLERFVLGDKKDDGFDAFTITKNAENNYRVKYNYSGLSLDVPKYNPYSGQILEQYADNTSDAQKWQFYKNDDGTYSIVYAASTKYAISYHDNVLTLENFTESDYQKFNIVAVENNEGSSDNGTPADNGDNNSNSTGANSGDNNDQSTNTGNNNETPTDTTTTSNQLVADGVYRIKSLVRNNFSLDVNGASSASGANVQVYTSNTTYAQKWTITYHADEKYYTIINRVTNKALDVYGRGTANKTNVQIWDQNTTCAQRWDIQKNSDNSYKIISGCDSKKVLDVNGGNTADKTNVQIYTDIGSKAQKWDLEKLDETQLIDDGTYRINSIVRSNFSLDVNGASSASGANVQAYTSNNTGAQQWVIKYNAAEKYYSIVNKNSNKALDVYGRGTADKTNVQIWDQNTTCAQRWDIRKNADGTYKFISGCDTKKVLDVNGGNTADKTNVQIYSDIGSKAQKWNIVTFY